MRKCTALIAVIILMSFGLGGAQQEGQKLFQKALAMERGEGNLEEAISLYLQVTQEAKDESLAAKAQLRIGICYEKLGKAEAQKAYQVVIEKYPGVARWQQAPGSRFHQRTECGLQGSHHR